MKDDIVEAEVVEDDSNLPAVSTSLSDLDTETISDLDEVRKNYKSLIEYGLSSITDLQALAEAADHPRVWEVYANTLQAIASMNKELIALHQAKYKMKADIAKSNGQGNVPGSVNTGTVNNNVIFAGTSQELLAMLKDK